MKILFLFCCLIYVHAANSQSDDQAKLNFSGYVETYYSYDFNRPDNHLRPDFLVNFNRHNEFSVNIALIKAVYESGKTRGTVGLMAGTYAQYNLKDETHWAQILNEASVGVKLHEKIWLDVGIMPSHIGFESWIGAEGWHLSRSIMAENSPYFFTGARVSYAHNSKTEIVAWLTNGWQNVQRKSRNQSLGLGLGVKHRPSKGLLINYSNYLGNDAPQPVWLMRFFNNFYVQYEQNAWATTVGLDMGIEQNYFGKTNQWYGVIVSLRRTINQNFNVAARAEHYSDPRGVIVNQGLKTSGLSANVDYHLTSKALLRIEARQFISREPVFSLPEARFSKGNTAITSSLSVSF